jgi:hypothetical protein
MRAGMSSRQSVVGLSILKAQNDLYIYMSENLTHMLIICIVYRLIHKSEVRFFKEWYIQSKLVEMKSRKALSVVSVWSR